MYNVAKEILHAITDLQLLPILIDKVNTTVHPDIMVDEVLLSKVLFSFNDIPFYNRFLLPLNLFSLVIHWVVVLLLSYQSSYRINILTLVVHSILLEKRYLQNYDNDLAIILLQQYLVMISSLESLPTPLLSFKIISLQVCVSAN